MNGDPDIEPSYSYDMLPCRLFMFSVMLPILIGASIYVLFRSQHVLVNHALNAIGLRICLAEFRALASGIRLPLPIVNSLPDGLWVFAFTNLIILIWDRSPPWYWLICGVGLGIGSELGQAFKIIPGSYDFGNSLAV